ncbi:MAG: tripartite tricarboxylate transporter TctB family protein [Geminicoccaceae bacterium]
MFAGAGVFVAYQGYALGIEGLYGPGPGFVAFWAGLPLAILCIVWFARISLRSDQGVRARFVAQRADMVRVASVLAALVAFMILLKPLGFNLAMLALLLFLFIAYSRDHLVLKIAIAFVASFGVHYAFERFLRVPLPYASVGFLSSLGF